MRLQRDPSIWTKKSPGISNSHFAKLLYQNLQARRVVKASPERETSTEVQRRCLQ